MIWRKLNSTWSKLALAVVLIGASVAGALATTSPAAAHCDSEKGPVAVAAHQALESADVKLVLPYVKPEAEAELTAAFKEVMAVRKNKAARELADRYFIETAIRLHRAGEGAAYTGVTDEETPRAILVADAAMASGSTAEVYHMLEEAIQAAVEEKYQAVVAARAEAKRLNTVEAHRERVEAELIFEKYVYDLVNTISSSETPMEGHSH
ncbi:MAG TPA: DUF6448 family protein [Anaerolineaceae bacterium]|nr:DUF6448 family protein [Anaerolineaceae bacterium]